MNPRLAALSAYLPAPSWRNSKFPSAEVRVDSGFLGFLVSKMVTRARPRGLPPSALTTFPAIRECAVAGPSTELEFCPGESAESSASPSNSRDEQCQGPNLRILTRSSKSIAVARVRFARAPGG